MTTREGNPWIAFLKEHKGYRLTLPELRELYYKDQLGGTEDIESIEGTEYTEDMEYTEDIEDTLLSDEIKRINRKIKNHDELTDEESQLWRAEFRRVLSDDYKYTQQELLSTYDVWLKRIKYNSGIYEAKMSEFQNTIQTRKYPSVDAFLKAVTDFFDIEELYSAEVL